MTENQTQATEEEKDKAIAALAAFAEAFVDTRGRLQRENPAALEAMIAGKPIDNMPPMPKRRPNLSILDFKRDITGENVLIGRRWGVRGTIVMIVSSTGTGKSVVQTQMAVSFAHGLSCCGLSPRRPFRSWIIQSEDDEDRVAIDRDDIFAELNELHPEINFNSDTTRNGVRFLDFTSFTGAKFLDELERELFLCDEAARPGCIFINPMNAYFGGSLKEGVDCSAFFKGGYIAGQETRGLEYIAKQFGVLIVIFGHTPKPPTPKELQEWTDDPNICYKMCGASEIADAVRSILVFLRVPDTDGLFVFNAGKNGFTLDWTDPHGKPTTKSYWRWAASGRHFWEEVPKDEWPGANDAKAVAARGELDADVRVLLDHMPYPGLNVRTAKEVLKPLGVTSRRAQAAFYEVVRNRMKYNVSSNVMPAKNGMQKTLYYRIDAPSAPAQATQTQSAVEQPALQQDEQYETYDPIF